MRPIFFVILLLTPSASAAQYALGGHLSVEARHGGTGARPLLNGTPGAGRSFYVAGVHLFATADLAERWWVDVAVHADRYGSAELSPLGLGLLSVSGRPFRTPSLGIQAGRILSPFGREPDRYLAADNPFVHRPLLYEWHLRIDPEVGFFRSTPTYEGFAGQPVAYGRMVVEGAAATVTLGEGAWLNATAAVTTGAPSVPPRTLFRRPGLVGRVALKPSIWSRLGASAAYGPYARASDANDVLARTALDRQTQLTLSADASVDYAYYAVAVQYTWSRWRTFWLDLAPAADNPLPTSTQGFPLLDADVRPRMGHLLVEAVVDLPALVGMHLGLRYERARFNRFRLSLPPGIDKPTAVDGWMPRYGRLEGVVGYALTRQVRLKLSYTAAANAGEEVEDDVAALQLSVRL